MITWLRRVEFALAAFGFALASASIVETVLYLINLLGQRLNLIGAPILITPIVWLVAAFLLMFPVAFLSWIDKTFFT